MLIDISGWSHLSDISEDVFVLRNKFLCLFFFDRVNDYVYDDNEDFVCSNVEEVCLIKRRKQDRLRYGQNYFETECGEGKV